MIGFRQILFLALLFITLAVRSTEIPVLGPEVLRWLPTEGLVGGSSFDGKAGPPGEQSVKGRIGRGFRIGEGEAYTLRGLNNAPVGDWGIKQPFSLSLWVKLDVDAMGRKALVTRKESGALARGWGLYTYAGAGVIMMELGEVAEGRSIRCATPRNLERRGGWHQVVMTYDGSSQGKGVSIAIDGERQKLQIWKDEAPASIRVAGDTLVGKRQGGGEKATQITIDELRIYDRVLEDIEIARLARLVPGRPIGKAARVRVTQENGPLTLAEVEAFVGGFNVAGSGQASQSSAVDGAGAAARVIDGNTNGKYAAGSVSLTKGGSQQWWQVDLAFPAAVERLVLWNRDDDLATSSALSGSKVEVFDEVGKLLWSQRVPKPAQRKSRFDIGLVDLEALRLETVP